MLHKGHIEQAGFNLTQTLRISVSETPPKLTTHSEITHLDLCPENFGFRQNPSRPYANLISVRERATPNVRRATTP